MSSLSRWLSTSVYDKKAAGDRLDLDALVIWPGCSGITELTDFYALGGTVSIPASRATQVCRPKSRRALSTSCLRSPTATLRLLSSNHLFETPHPRLMY